jgi:hypothetical protein
LTIEKASDDRANNAARPSDAARAFPRFPRAIPATDANPCRRPCTTLRVTI